MALALFDLDNTLLNGDSDYLWGQYLVKNSIVDGDFYERENQRFYDDYKNGNLDIYEFLSFSLNPLSQHDMEQLKQWRSEFVEQMIEPILQPKAFALIDRHRAQGDELIVITATNRFVTEPIVAKMGIENLLATEPEIVSGRYTGKPYGTPCFQDGKIKHLEAWLKERDLSLTDSWFYSDSHNDLPLLKMVDNPVAVDPDDTLRRFAAAQNWPIISLHEESA